VCASNSSITANTTTYFDAKSSLPIDHMLSIFGISPTSSLAYSVVSNRRLPYLTNQCEVPHQWVSESITMIRSLERYVALALFAMLKP